MVDLARIGEGLFNRLLRDFVKNQAFDGHLRLKQFIKMPTDRLTLAVFVRRQIEALRLLEKFAQFSYLLFFTRGNDINGREIAFDVHAKIGPILVFVLLGDLFFSLGEIANVTDARLDGKIASQKFGNRASLGRRFDDHQGLDTFFGRVIRHLLISLS